MSKKSRKREREDREEREKLNKRMKKIEEMLASLLPANPPEQPPCEHEVDTSSAPSTKNHEEKASSLRNHVEETPSDTNAPSLTDAQAASEKRESAQVTLADATKLDSSSGKNPTKKPINESALKILGEDPTKTNENEPELDETLAYYWSHYLAEGLKKEEKEKLVASYPKAKNCHLQGQILNAEVEEIMTPSAIKRDGYSKESQDLTGSALLAVGLALSLILEESEDDIDVNLVSEHLSNAGKLLCEIHHHEATSRKAFIIPGVEKSMKSVVENSKMDKFLFGDNLSERINQKKSLVKTASDLKPKPLAKPAPPKYQPNLNLKAPPSYNSDSKEGGKRRFSKHRSNKDHTAPRNPSVRKSQYQNQEKQQPQTKSQNPRR